MNLLAQLLPKAIKIEFEYDSFPGLLPRFLVSVERNFLTFADTIIDLLKKILFENILDSDVIKDLFL